MEILYFICCILQPICLPVPEMATVLWGTMMIGSEWTLLLGVLGSTIGIVLMYTIAAYGVAYLMQNEKLQHSITQFQYYIQEYCFLVIGLLFVIPVLPDEVICIGGALTGIDFKKFIAVAFLSKFVSIGIVAYANLIAEVCSLNRTQIICIEVILLLIAAQIFKVRHRQEKQCE